MEDEVTEIDDSISFPKGNPYCSLLNDLHYGTRRKRSTGLPSSCIGWVLSAYTFLVIIFVLVGATHGLGYLGSKAFKDRLDAGEIAVLVANILFFVYVEGYLGFYRSWAPVTANRCMLAGSLLCREQPIQSGFLILFSPLFALGYFWASKRRLVISYMLIVMIFLLAIGVRSLPQPWHAIADCGVAAGLGTGTLSFVYFYTLAIFRKVMPPDVDHPITNEEDHNDHLDPLIS